MEQKRDHIRARTEHEQEQRNNYFSKSHSQQNKRENEIDK